MEKKEIRIIKQIIFKLKAMHLQNQFFKKVMIHNSILDIIYHLSYTYMYKVMNFIR